MKNSSPVSYWFSFGRALALTGAIFILSSSSTRAAEPAFSWQSSATSLALMNGDKIVWKLVFDPKEPKSYFHPLATVDGELLTALRPADHPWHLGLWWSWKFINGVNYWEFGKTGKAQGETELLSCVATPGKDFSARAEMKISYHPPGKPEVLKETRTLLISTPDKQGNYSINWTSVFTAGDTPVKLDRTPPARKRGPSWGGYAGLSLRLAPGLKEWKYLNSAGQTGVPAAIGQTARWVDFSGPKAGITIFDDPRNLRHPTIWYLIQGMPFFTPAFLYDDPFEMKPKDVLELRYRVLVHNRPLTKEEIEGK